MTKDPNPGELSASAGWSAPSGQVYITELDENGMPKLPSVSVTRVRIKWANTFLGPDPEDGICLQCGRPLVRAYDPFEVYHPAEEYRPGTAEGRDGKPPCEALLPSPGTEIWPDGPSYTLRVSPDFFLKKES
jgi:hypothetical protein